MEIINNLKNFSTSERTIVTIGTFDGVHIGHQKIIENLVATSQKNNRKSVLLTFFPHPRMVLQKDVDIKLINTIEERGKLLEKTGLDYLIIHPFSKEFSRLTALDFVREILVEQLNISKLVIGYDHHFGKNREGNIEQLIEYSHMFEFEVEEISAQDIDNIAVSSTKIRHALENGKIKKANSFLGYNFMLSGTVVGGRQLGQQIGYPTANLAIKESYKLIPKTGVYLIKSTIHGVLYFGMMNIGKRPTVNGKHQTIEIHFLDFNKNIYNETINVEILDFLRDEQKFESVEKLRDQLHQDKAAAYQLIKALNNTQ